MKVLIEKQQFNSQCDTHNAYGWAYAYLTIDYKTQEDVFERIREEEYNDDKTQLAAEYILSSLVECMQNNDRRDDYNVDVDLESEIEAHFHMSCVAMTGIDSVETIRLAEKLFNERYDLKLESEIEEEERQEDIEMLKEALVIASDVETPDGKELFFTFDYSDGMIDKYELISFDSDEEIKKLQDALYNHVAFDVEFDVLKETLLELDLYTLAKRQG